MCLSNVILSNFFLCIMNCDFGIFSGRYTSIVYRNEASCNDRLWWKVAWTAGATMCTYETNSKGFTPYSLYFIDSFVILSQLNIKSALIIFCLNNSLILWVIHYYLPKYSVVTWYIRSNTNLLCFIALDICLFVHSEINFGAYMIQGLAFFFL